MMHRVLALLIAVVVSVAMPAVGQQWTTVQVVTTADGSQQLILRNADGTNPRRISVSNLLAGAGSGSGSSSGSGGNPVQSATWDAATDTLTLTLDSGATRTVTIPVPEQRVLVDADATDDTLDSIILHEDEAYLTVTRQQAGTPQTATFRDFTDANLIGFLEADPRPDAYSVGQWYWNVHSLRPRVVIDLDPVTPGVQKGWADATLTVLVPGGEAYTGRFRTDAEAGSHVVAVGDIYYNSTDRTLKVCTAITAGSGVTVVYEQDRLLKDEDRISLSTQDNELAAQLAVERVRVTGALGELQTLEAAVAALGDVQSVTVATVGSYQATLNSQFGSSEPLVLVIGADISGTFTHPSTGVSTTISWDSGDVLWLPPRSVSPELLFTLPDGPRDYGARATAVAGAAVIGNAVQVSRTDHIHNLPLDPAQLAFDGAGQLTIAQSFIDGLGSGGGGGGGVEVVNVHVGNVAIASDRVFVDAGFEWPAGVPWLLVQYNPAGRFAHREFVVVYNPRVGRWAGDTTGLAAAVVGDSASATNATGVDVVSNLGAEGPEFISAFFGVTSTGRALITSSSAAIDPTPLVVLAVVPSGGASTGSPGREFVLQDALRANADTAGVTTMQLPTDYQDYEYVEIVARNSGAGEPSRSTGAVTIPTTYLALQQDADNARFGIISDENGNQQWLDWTLSTRTFVAGAEDGAASVVVRIVYARLYNSGITGVDIPNVPASDGDYVLSVDGQAESWSAAPAAWPGDISFSPAEIVHGRAGAQSYNVFLHAEPGVYPAGAKFRATVGGNNGSLVTIDTVTPAASVVALNAASAGSLSAAAARDGLSRVDVLVYSAATTTGNIGSAVPLARLHNVIPFDSEGQWRPLTRIGEGNTYSASLLDHSFKVQVNKGTDGSINVDVARAQLTAGTPFRMIAMENRPDATNNQTALYVDLTLNAAGTGLTVALARNSQWTGGADTDGTYGQYTIGVVLGR